MTKRSGKIPWEDFVNLAPSEPGVQVRVDHVNCPAGEDRRKRLYILRSEDGRGIVAYCHNCGLDGHYLEGYTNVHSIRSSNPWDGLFLNAPRKDVVSAEAPLMLPEKMVLDLAGFPHEALLLLSNYRLDSSMVKWWGIGYDPTSRRLVYPLYTKSGLQGYQLRRVFEDDPYPKYLTFNRKDAYEHHGEVLFRPVSGLTTPLSSRKHLVVVEDLISGIRVMEAHQDFRALVLQGIYLPAYMGLISTRNKSVTIWLDNDSERVRVLAKTLCNKLKLAGRVFSVFGVFNEEEPKKLSSDDITGVLMNTVALGHQE